MQTKIQWLGSSSRCWVLTLGNMRISMCCFSLLLPAGAVWGLFRGKIADWSYSLQYQNRKAEYFGAIWDVINWKTAEKRFE